MSRQLNIEQQLKKALEISALHVENESRFHHVPANSETHFKVTIVSPKFTAMTLVNRHRLINTLLQDEFDAGLHALALHTYTPEEWQKKGGNAIQSPKCKDGFNK